MGWTTHTLFTWAFLRGYWTVSAFWLLWIMLVWTLRVCSVVFDSTILYTVAHQDPVHGIFLARIWECVTRESSQPRDWNPCLLHWQVDFFYHCATWKTDVQISAQVPLFTLFVYIPRTGMAGSHVNSVFKFLRNHQTAIHSRGTF